MTWRCKGCGFVISQDDIDNHGGFCQECRNE